MIMCLIAQSIYMRRSVKFAVHTKLLKENGYIRKIFHTHIHLYVWYAVFK